MATSPEKGPSDSRLLVFLPLWRPFPHWMGLTWVINGILWKWRSLVPLFTRAEVGGGRLALHSLRILEWVQWRGPLGSELNDICQQQHELPGTGVSHTGSRISSPSSLQLMATPRDPEPDDSAKPLLRSWPSVTVWDNKVCFEQAWPFCKNEESPTAQGFSWLGQMMVEYSEWSACGQALNAFSIFKECENLFGEPIPWNGISIRKTPVFLHSLGNLWELLRRVNLWISRMSESFSWCLLR